MRISGRALSVSVQTFALLTVLMVSASALYADNIIVDPSFEDGSSAWRYALSAVRYVGFGHTDDYSGAVYSGAAGSIDQIVDTDPGVTYDVNFWYTYDVSTPSDALFAVRFSSDGTYGLYETGAQLAQAGAPYQWVDYNFLVTATDPTTELAFIGEMSAGAIWIDDVSVSAVPEPSSILLLGIGLLILGISVRHNNVLLAAKRVTFKASLSASGPRHREA